jgi:hypothetical protein
VPEADAQTKSRSTGSGHARTLEQLNHLDIDGAMCIILGGRTHPLIGHESESQWRMAQPMRHELLQIQVLHSQTAQLV